MNPATFSTQHNKSGFTLIEIVIVLSIASLIMVGVFFGVNGALVAQRDSERKTYARELLAGLATYRGNNSDTLDGIDAPTLKSYVGDDRKVLGQDVQTGSGNGLGAVMVFYADIEDDNTLVNGDACPKPNSTSSLFFVNAGTGITNTYVAMCLESSGVWFVQK